MKKIGIFMAQGCEEIEGLTVVDVLRRGGIEIDMISITSEKEIKGSHNIHFFADVLGKDIKMEDYDGIILPGGMPGTMNLLESGDVLKVVKELYKKGKLVAAICAAPMVLGHCGILEGKKATCHPGFEEKLTLAIPVEKKVVRDGNVITSRGMGTAIEFALEIMDYFKGEEAAAEVAKGLVYSY